MKKLSNTEAELKKKVLLMKKASNSDRLGAFFSEHIWWLLFSDVPKLKERKNRTHTIYKWTGNKAEH